MNDLFPKPRRRMLQPTKNALRQRIADLEQQVADERERTGYWRNVARYAADPGVNEWLQAQGADVPPGVIVEIPAPQREGNPITALLQRLFRRTA